MTHTHVNDSYTQEGTWNRARAHLPDRFRKEDQGLMKLVDQNLRGKVALSDMCAHALFMSIAPTRHASLVEIPLNVPTYMHEYAGDKSASERDDATKGSAELLGVIDMEVL